MSTSPEHPSPRAAPDTFAGGEMGERIRAFDWTQTPLGPVESWPQSLKTTVRLMLSSRYPMFVWWGPGLTKIYNDAYILALGKRHPQALGRSAPEVWADIWGTVGPQADIVLNEGRTTWNEELLLLMERYGYTEETYFTFSYRPVPDDAGGVGGVFCVCMEDTARVIGKRRLKTLSDLGERSLAEAKTVEQACHAAAVTLAENPYDCPFTLIYALDEGGRRARLCEAVKLSAGTKASPLAVAIDGDDDVWSFRRAIETGQVQIIENLEERFGLLRAGPWADDWTKRALVLPLARAGVQELPAGFLIAGVSPRLEFNDDYRSFLDLVAGQIATAIANVRAYEEERRRAEALAELDRAKTAFFSNVSHEFRTPLTLMLGPLEDTLAQTDRLSGEDRERLEVAYRNSLRLLKLVNTLLDFSRIEAGRIEASYEPVDLAALTADLASVFRSAIERAGLRLLVDCPPLGEPVYVDREMWEKIVSNLLSNAFKFTFSGEIEISLRPAGKRVELAVRDTGTGIPADELPNLFERFHRVKAARGRTFEGSGIGLALVQELVSLHGGEVRVESEIDQGTTFTVSIPTGTAHLPANRIGTTRTSTPAGARGEVYVEEALRWLPSPPDSEPLEPVRDPQGPPRILLADDNADMNAYVQRLLGEKYNVVAVPDGAAALQAAREMPFDLVLADVMMPVLDGFGLLRALRADDSLKTIPVLLLSARAGEESKVEGLEAGADDYLIKPFSARELLARVEGHLRMARLRREVTRALRESERSLSTLIGNLPGFVFRCLNDETWTMVFISEGVRDMTGYEAEDFLARRVTWDSLIHPGDVDRVRADAAHHIEQRTPIRITYRILTADGQVRWVWDRATPVFAAPDEIVSWEGFVTDVTERIQAETALRESEAKLQAALDGGRLGAWSWDPVTHRTTADARVLELFGLDPARFTGDAREIFKRIHPDDRPMAHEALRQAQQPGGEYYAEFRVVSPDGAVRWLAGAGRARQDAGGQVREVHGVNFDITERKRGELHTRFLLELDAALAQLAGADEIEQAAMDHLGAHLEVEHCYFGQIAGGRATVLHEYRSGGASILGDYDLGDFFSPEAREQLTQGMAVIVSDVRTDPCKAALAANHTELGIGAFITTPVKYHDRWVGALNCVSRKPRAWHTDELRLMQDVAARVWPLIEQARAAQALRQADRRKDEFLAMLAHELRNPLAPIRNAAQVLRLVGPSDTHQQWAREVIERQTQHLTRLVDDLLDVSRITQGKVKLSREPLDLAAILHRAVEASRPLIDSRHHQLTVVTPPEPVRLEGDLTRLVQVVGNLLNNAAKYTDEGGHIQIEAAGEGAEAVIRVRDNGMGLPPDLLPHVFDLFTQADRSLDRSQGGLGIGLTLVRQLVELHGGRVEARSAGFGQGSEFTVRLPATAPTVSPGSEAAGELSASASRTLKILVVEDNVDSAEMMSFLLKLGGHEVRTARDGLEALEAARAFEPQAVLCDIGLPGMNGYEVAARLRQQPAFQQTPLIALTGYGEEEARRRSREAGFDYHLVKPVEPDALDALLESLR